MTGPIKVLIVSDDDLFRQRIRTLLESADDIAILGEAHDGGEAINLIGEMPREAQPGIILLDIDTSHGRSLETVEQIGELFPHTRMIVLSTEGQEGLVLDAFRKGALGHLAKESTRPDEIVQAIHAVNRGEAVLSPGVAGNILDEVIVSAHKPKPTNENDKEESRA